MAKALIFVYIIVAAVLLLFLSHSPKKLSGHRHRRLKLRSNFTLAPSRHHAVAFDPLVAELERHREDKEWEKQIIHQNHLELDPDRAPAHESQPEWEDFMDAEDYLNDEDKFNVTNRLILLFPKIDVDPTDRFVTEHELTQWNLQQAQREVLHRTQREMELHDKNHDGFVSFSEYDPPSWVQNAGVSLFHTL
ncbi:unnamed protein product [Sphenostylis stenocarpa]|uniref:Calumenin n=1 Tax=Sphenostylis stenocarpa TaxID=92480 RepID=A0AA86W4E9_9FABA|nr:unnamed protein product [Sphenostylis stenocarpa]